MDRQIGYTIEEAAPLISVTENQLRDLVTARRIRHSRVGGENGRGVRFTREQLEDFMARNEVAVQE